MADLTRLKDPDAFEKMSLPDLELASFDLLALLFEHGYGTPHSEEWVIAGLLIAKRMRELVVTKYQTTKTLHVAQAHLNEWGAARMGFIQANQNNAASGLVAASPGGLVLP